VVVKTICRTDINSNFLRISNIMWEFGNKEFLISNGFN